MKNIHYLLIMIIIFSLSSCNDNDENYNEPLYRLEHVNVLKAELPDEFDYGRLYNLDVTIELPSRCYSYHNQLDYIYQGNSRLIYPIAHVDDDVVCTPSTSEIEFTIPVRIVQNEPYIFKFYQGKDSNGKDTFLRIEVPISKNQKNIENIGIDTNNKTYK